MLVGANAIAGEWGHNPLPWPRADELPGPPCSCGRAGHIEAWLSGPGLVRSYRAAGGAAPDAPAVVARLRAGEARARACFDAYLDRLARALATMINVFDPDVIVVGGGLSNVDELYDEVPRRWGAYVYSDRVDTRFVRNRHGDSSGVRGAAWVGALGAAGTSV
jgi:predicted NBD/HSP70 family sugar kinase